MPAQEQRNPNRRQKVVVAHSGRRDAYQVAAAFAEQGLLDRLITDLYWPADRGWAGKLSARVGSSVRRALKARYSPLVPSALVQQTLLSGLTSYLLYRMPLVPFALRQQAMRWNDAVIGSAAGKRALASDATLLSYSYYGFHAFSTFGRPGMLFQAHPHPASVRKMLQRELEQHPDCAESLKKEWELSLPARDFHRLAREVEMAAHHIVASSFTRQTLIENGVASESITVIPYGIDLQKFSPAAQPPALNGPLKLLFVGSINQRKGIKYLLEALDLLQTPEIELTVCGRVCDNLALFQSRRCRVSVRPNVAFSELLEAYRSSDLFVFPSVAEGFGQVLLESMACGLPILSTTRTAAPDLIREGVEGFVVEPGRADVLAERIEWALHHRPELHSMRTSAAARASQFTWARFRSGVVETVHRFQSTGGQLIDREAQYV